MDKITVNEFLIQELNRLGIKDVFGLPGDFNFSIIDAVENNPNTNWIGCTNELNAGYAADGYARINGYGALVTTYSVGELSAINAIAGCYAENVPVISIVGIPKTKFIRDNAVIHHNFCQPNYYANYDAYSNFVQAGAYLSEDNAKDEIERILSIFVKDKKPVYIAIPVDVGQMYIENSPKIKEAKSDKKKLEKAVEHALKLIEKSNNPVILGDVLLERFQAKNEFQQLVKNSRFPASTLIMGKGIINESESNFIGTYLGTLDNIDVYNTVNNSDCVISVGTIISDFNTLRFDIRIKPANFIEIQGTYTIIECKAYEDVMMKDILTELANRVRQREVTYLKNRPELCSTQINEEVKLDYDYLLARFQEFLKPNDLLITETGTFDFAAPSLTFPDKCLLVSQLLWGSIGWATPASFGAVMADKERRTILLTGEGSHQLTFQSISNMMYKKLKPIVIVLNNSGYTIERSVSKNPLDPYNDIIPWDYMKLAETFDSNIFTAQARTNKEFDEVLKQAESVNQEKLCYIELFTDKLDMPPLMKKMSERARAQNNMDESF